jgi:hypothetical protein
MLPGRGFWSRISASLNTVLFFFGKNPSIPPIISRSFRRNTTPQTNHRPRQILLVVGPFPLRDRLPARLANMSDVLEAFGYIGEAAAEKGAAKEGGYTTKNRQSALYGFMRGG